MEGAMEEGKSPARTAAHHFEEQGSIAQQPKQLEFQDN
jgi:hypothetical protein